MRVKVNGTNSAAKQMRSIISRDNDLVLGASYVSSFLINFETTDHITVDGVDSEIERLIVSSIARQYRVMVLPKRSDTDAITIGVPDDDVISHAVEIAVYRALLSMARPAGFWARIWRWLF